MRPKIASAASAKKIHTPASYLREKLVGVGLYRFHGRRAVVKQNSDGDHSIEPRRCPFKPLGVEFYIPLEHFLAAASQCMPAFSHAACVLGVPANAGALNATIRLRARTETNVFIRISSDAVTSQCESVQNVTMLVVLCYAVSRPAWFVAAGTHN